MDFWEVIRLRRSVRQYDPERDVPLEQIDQILEAAILAPSGGHCQSWRFFVVRDRALRGQLAVAAEGRKSLTEAPVVIVICCDPRCSADRYGERGANLFSIQDVAAATEHILLAATALGLGSLWVGSFDEGSVARVLDLPEHLRPVALVVIGHLSVARPGRRPRRPLAEVVEYR
jgi:nitroreductase